MEQIRVTEQASAYDDLQRMTVHDLLTGINREDRRVADAVAATIPTMERLVERIVERMQRGGRMFYIGAGTSGRLAVTDASELPPTYGVPFDTVIGLIAGGDGALRKAVEHAEDDTEGAWRDMQPWRPDSGDILIGARHGRTGCSPERSPAIPGRPSPPKRNMPWRQSWGRSSSRVRHG